MEMKELFKRHKEVIFLSVVEAKNGEGIRTYFNPMISAFNQAYKDQLISFLKGVVKDLEKGGKKNA